MTIRRVGIEATQLTGTQVLITADPNGETHVKKLSFNNTDGLATATVSVHRVSDAGAPTAANQVISNLLLGTNETKTPFSRMDIVINPGETIQTVTTATGIVVDGWYLVNTQ